MRNKSIGGLITCGALAALALSGPERGASRVDLTRSGDTDARARGTILYVEGVVTDPGGAPIADADLAIWQTDARGYYREEAVKRELLDPAFGYRANLRTDADGRFILVTILPASYAEHPDVTPHIHVAITRPGRSVVNREIVFRNHPAQRAAPPAHTRAFVAGLVPADEREPGSLRCVVTLVTDR